MNFKGNKLEKYLSTVLVLSILLIWQLACSLGSIPDYMLPSPINIVKAFVLEFPTLMFNSLFTLWEAILGLLFSIICGVLLAIIMDNSRILEKSISPILLMTQTVPPIAIAPLLILWMGYGVLPKVVLVFLTCFFPITIGMLGGLKESDKDAITMLKSMGASKYQVYRYIKLPSSISAFFSGLKISSTYALVAAVVAEWLGGNDGLGVYMTRVRKSYSLDKMFAVIFLISLISLGTVKIIKLIEKNLTPWNNI